MNSTGSDLHDAYAPDYDAQVQAYECYIADLLFGLVYEYIQPGQNLLDIGIGSGLSAWPFARVGLEIYGMDFSPVMLEICKSKNFARDLRLHDLRQVPWPYSRSFFNCVVSCGVFHFVANLDVIFGEARRVLTEHGIFAFTTRFPVAPDVNHLEYELHTEKDFEIYSHLPSYVESLLDQNAFTELKRQKCFVGDGLFLLWIAQKRKPSIQRETRYGESD